MNPSPPGGPFRHGQVAVGHLKRKLGHRLVQADRLSQRPVKDIQIKEVLPFPQQGGVKGKLGGVKPPRLRRAQVDRVGDAHRRGIPEMKVELEVNPREGLRHPPGDAHPDEFGVGKDAGFLAHKVQRLQPQPLAGAGGHAGDVHQIIVDHIDVGGLHIDRDGLLHVAVKDHPAFVQHHAAGAELTDGAHVVAHIQDGTPLLPGHIAHFAQAFLLEFHVAHGQDLVHDHDLAVQMGRHREGQLDEHTAGIALDGGIDKVAALGKLDDLVNLGIHFRLGHAQNGAVHIDVFPSGHLVVESGAHLQHGGHPAPELDFALGGGGDAGEDLEQGGFARAVASDNAQRLALIDRQIHPVEGHKGLAKEPRIGADHRVGVFFAAHAGPPALKIMGQRAAADLAQAVLFFQPCDLDNGHAPGILLFHCTHPPVIRCP